ncbi:hypothetical protein NPIL_136841 [Nephila pilipes]|uniref:Uncharacterized protein n=1 Tax=Nephila pilipes TaxID=299642 RepID=A0A8X6MQH2_NEPPI|nr:hypothetical protein NPIL_136841 [Nephila pilipes]
MSLSFPIFFVLFINSRLQSSRKRVGGVEKGVLRGDGGWMTEIRNPLTQNGNVMRVRMRRHRKGGPLSEVGSSSFEDAQMTWGGGEDGPFAYGAHEE